MGASDKNKRGSLSDYFHQGTKLISRGADDLKPEGEHGTQGEPEAMKPVNLPAPNHCGVPLEEALRKRRSVRRYAQAPLSLAALSDLLFAAQGKTGSAFGHALRTTPSAGALYPVELYVIVNNVENLEQGIYRYF